MKYKLDHDNLTPREAAENLRIKVNGVLWKATRIEFVRRKVKGQQWVHLIIVDSDSGLQQTIFMKRPQLYKAWVALFFETITPTHVENLIIEVNNERCGALSVEIIDELGEDWIELAISCPSGGKQIITLNHQDMINAYYALFNGNVLEMFEDGMNMLGSLFE